MSNQHSNPEAISQLPPALQEFQYSAEKMRADFTFEHINGLNMVDGGVVDYDSLGVALDKVSKAAGEDPSVLTLIEAVNTQNKVRQEQSDQPLAYVKAADRPEFALLKIFGAAKKSERKPYAAPIAAEKRPTPSAKAKKYGHQILADGHMVQGLIIPGRNEIQTAHGVVKARGNPRLGV